MEPLPPFTSGLLAEVRRHYESAPTESKPAARGYRWWLAHYYNLIIPAEASVLEIGCGSGELLARLRARDVTGVDLSAHQIEAARRRLPHGRFFEQAGESLEVGRKFDYIIISDTMNYAADVQRMLAQAQTAATAETRLVVNFASALWRPAYFLATAVGGRARHPQSSWLSVPDVKNLLALAGWRVIKTDPRLLLPLRLFGLDRLANQWLGPFLPWFCLCVFCAARSAKAGVAVADPVGQDAPSAGALAKAGLQSGGPPTVSVVVPARNEAGNIEAAVRRTPEMGAGTELIFIEGHSRDDTWAQIQRVKRDFPERKIKILRQTGKGKGDAVRAGFDAASGDILMILDADLTMPPEELTKFYSALVSGQAEFCNGVRLVYPMEKEAMRFLNLCANKLFGLAFTWLLGQPVKDTLCGTKTLRKKDWIKIAAHREFFGDFDPFGDFDLLFGAAKLNLQIADIPIRYRERTYGSTNIHRWRHGWLLLRMVAFAARKLKFV